MLRAQKVYWLAQLTGWALLDTLILSATLAKSDVPISYLVISSSLFFVSGIVLSHGMRFLFIRWGWLSMRLGPLIPRVLILSIFAATIMSLLDSLMSMWVVPSANPTPLRYLLLEIFTSSLFFLLWNGIYFTFHFFQKSQVEELKNLQLIASQNEIELKNLRSQLNPHFLFNSLNSIRALVDLYPYKAKENITTLSNLLRKSLLLGKERLVPLKSELDLVTDYLELEKVRFEERLTIVINHDPQLDEIPVPPFIIQTLVENAFKHGISRLIEGGSITITSQLENGKVAIIITNDGILGKGTDSGIGLENTKRRLELQYGAKAAFSLVQSGKKVIATIELTQ